MRSIAKPRFKMSYPLPASLHEMLKKNAIFTDHQDTLLRC